MYFDECFEWCGPLSDSLDFGRVDGGGTVGNNVAEIFDGCLGECAFGKFAAPFVCGEAAEDDVKVSFVRRKRWGVDENVVEVYDDKMV